MIINTPYGNAEVPDNYANEYKDKTDIELIEILLEQNKRFLDPVLVQICVNRNLLKKGEAVEDLEMKLYWLKVQEYSKLKVENEKLKEEGNKSYLVKLFDDENKKLKQQLKEKDKEIKKLKKDWKRDVRELEYSLIDLEDKLKTTTKQICEKIRNEINNHNGLIYGFTMNNAIFDLLDQIERGKIY